MAIRKVKSKKYGYTYQIDIKYKNQYGESLRHIESNIHDLNVAKKREKEFLENVELEKLKNQTCEKTFNDVFLEYMELEGMNKYANATMVNYTTNHQRYIKDNIGKEKITSLKYKEIQRYFNQLSQKYGFPTLKNIKKIFSVTFRYALKHGYVRENPVHYLQLSKDDRPRVDVKTVSDDDLQKIVNEIQKVNKNNPYKDKWEAMFTAKAYAIAILIGRYTGLRVSEVLALKKEDFDFEKNTMNVHSRVEYAGLKKSEVYVTERLKSKSSKSVLPISQAISQMLKQWFEVNPYEYVVCNGKGKILHPEVLNKRIRDVSHSLGIKFHFHMLRHTYATELIKKNINPVIVKGLMRHSSVDTTVNIYIHVNNKEQREALDGLYSDMHL